MKISILISRMDISGGTERIVSTLANHWIKDGKKIDLIVLYSKESFYYLDKKINIISLGASAYPNTGGIVRQIKWYVNVCNLFYEYIKNNKPDFILGIMAQMSFITTIIGRICNVSNISCEHTQYYGYSKHTRYIRRIVYPFSSAVTTLTKSDKNLFTRFCKKVFVIPNTLSFKSNHNINYNSKKVIAVGRLVYSKGFDLLIEAWKAVNDKHPDWELIIIGGDDLTEPGYSDKLRNIVSKYHLTDNVQIMQAQTNIQEIYLDSSILVMPSRYEGFSLVLIEAMSLGIPVVSFDCPFGPREIIENNEDGFLIENGNLHELSNKINILIENKVLRKEMGILAKRNVEMKYEWKSIEKLWEQLFTVLKNN